MVYTIDQIRRIAMPIAAAYGVKSMRLFGSYARGEATDDSDVDILIDRGRDSQRLRSRRPVCRSSGQPGKGAGHGDHPGRRRGLPGWDSWG